MRYKIEECRRAMVEGYEAYYAGLNQEDCPYPDTGTVVSDHWAWIEGWKIASQEFQS